MNFGERELPVVEANLRHSGIFESVDSELLDSVADSCGQIENDPPALESRIDVAPDLDNFQQTIGDSKSTQKRGFNVVPETPVAASRDIQIFVD